MTEDENGDEIYLPYIAASPALIDFRVDWLASGMVLQNDILATSDAERLTQFENDLNLAGQCEGTVEFDYDDGAYTGTAALGVDCETRGRCESRHQHARW